MTRYMLDTNVLAHIVNRRGNWRIAVKNLARYRANICLSAVAYFELTNMILAARTGKAKARELANMVGALKVEPFNRRAADTAANLQVHLERSGRVSVSAMP